MKKILCFMLCLSVIGCADLTRPSVPYPECNNLSTTLYLVTFKCDGSGELQRSALCQIRGESSEFFIFKDQLSTGLTNQGLCYYFTTKPLPSSN